MIGLACDMVEGKILVSVNGSFDPPNGTVFRINRIGPGMMPGCACVPGCSDGRVERLRPAITGKTGAVRVNLGVRPFRYPVPGLAGYDSFLKLSCCP